ncbi:unnamed protein product [Rotaria magnacalcarata]|uniref:Uncharacterized protein n=6 Tax=Rotaria magnacalcarata TaxID=392030 RepID=A0A816PKT8_9BILA|nr:unnamed protein product [Rotaria magnacalcarata]
MVNMAGQQQHQQYSSRYPSLVVTVKNETEERSVAESYSNSRTRRSKDSYRPYTFQQKTVYYNSNQRHQQQQYYTQPQHTSPRRQQQQKYYNNYDRTHYLYQHQPLQPLMEIKDDLFSSHHDLNVGDNNDNDTTYHSVKQREPKQRGQYRNRKAELDWDHAFDLDLIDFYPTQNDIDSHSLTSTISSSDHSFSSI